MSAASREQGAALESERGGTTREQSEDIEAKRRAKRAVERTGRG